MTRLALVLARRELRAGLKGFGVFLACLALGTGTIAGVGSLAEAVVGGLHQNGRTLLGGDVALRRTGQPLTAQERAYLTAAGALSETLEMRAMVRPAEGGPRALVELKAVDNRYPLYGAVKLAPALPLAEALATQRGAPGAVGDPDLFARLGMRPGETIRLGDAEFVLRAAIRAEPDRVASGIGFGPRLMIGLESLPLAGLVRLGSLVRYHERMRLSPGTDVEAWVAGLKAALPKAGWRVRTFRQANPSLERQLKRLEVYLTVVGFTALLVGGIGVGGGVRAYLERKTDTVATLKCLGAPPGLVFRTYLIQIMALAALGLGLGLMLGALVPAVAAWVWAGDLPVPVAVELYPRPLLTTAAIGLLTALTFALWPLAKAREVSPAGLFRALVAPPRRWPPVGYVLAVGGAAGGLVGLGLAATGDLSVGLRFVGGAAATLLVCAASARGLKAAARALGRPRRPALRLALGNLARPGAATGAVMVSLGVGLTVLVTVAVVESNLAGELEKGLPERAPAFFFIDIQPDQAAAFDAAVLSVPGAGPVARVPSLRGRITRIRGVPAEDVRVDPEAAWALDSDRGVTYTAAMPAGTRLVAGSWWPADYEGPPLISFDAALAQGFGVGVGDAIAVNILGREIEARIANLRQIDWLDLGLNFTIIFAPGTLEGAPQTHIATVHAAPEAEARLEEAVAGHFRNVTAVPVREALESVTAVLRRIGTAMRATAAVALLAGVLVLAQATAAAHRHRVYDAVVLKVLGATRAHLFRAFLLEHLLMGLTAGLVAAAAGASAAWLLVTRVIGTPFALPWEALAYPVLAGAALSFVFGFAGIWRALARKAAPVLRNP